MSEIKNVIVNLDIEVDAKGELIILGDTPVAISNVIVADTTLPAAALYNSTDSMFEFWEPESAPGTTIAERSSITGDYKKLTCKLENDLHSCIMGKFDMSIPKSGFETTKIVTAAPFNDAKYGTDDKLAAGVTNEHRLASSFGELALKSYAHHIMGHVAATAAITNDAAFMNAMNSSAFVPYTLNQIAAGSAYSSDVVGSTSDAKLAKLLVKAIATKDGAAASKIANQVIGQDTSRAMDQDNNEADTDVRQPLKFIAGDVIYMNIKLQEPDVVISSGQKVSAATLKAKYAADISYTLKITLA